MHHLISVDPSTHTPCCAYWRVAPGTLELSGIEFTWTPGVTQHVVIESQQVYPGAAARSSDIIALAQAAGRIAGHVHALNPQAFITYALPRGWKGQTPKPRRAKDWQDYAVLAMVRASLRAGELALFEAVLAQHKVPQVYDIVDAVGLGLWQLKRLRSNIKL